jgi:C4-dicarboxylate-specific signal transduction histidine kinase
MSWQLPLPLIPIFKNLVTQCKQNYPKLNINLGDLPSIIVSIAKVNFNMAMKVILDNALDAGVTSIDISIESEADSVKILINDNGPGFDEFILENFGAPYISTKGKGHGIGLYSASLNIESMGGKLAINNTPNGAQFDRDLGEV